MAEEGVTREIAEQVLGHAVAGVEAAYMRSDLLERRREVLQTLGGLHHQLTTAPGYSLESY